MIKNAFKSMKLPLLFTFYASSAMFSGDVVFTVLSLAIAFVIVAES